MSIHFFFSSRRRHTISKRDWSSDVCSSDLRAELVLDQVKDRFSSIDGVAVTLTGRQLAQVYSHGSEGLLSVTPDAPAHVSGTIKWTSDQLWPYETGNANNWETDQNATVAANMPTIAIVDSG